MSTAYVLLPSTVHYRREAFINGFARLGYIVEQGSPVKPLGERDAALVWNMTARSRQAITMSQEGAGALLVAENGFYGADETGHQLYAIALEGHNGSGRWYAPDDSRLKKLAIDFKPFRSEEGGKVLIADQRGIGSPLMRSPPHFASSTATVLSRGGFEPAVRPHPGQNAPATNLMDDLENAQALVVWSSNCATQPLVGGLPTYYCAPTIVSAPASQPFTPKLKSDFSDDRRYQAFAKMAWAQWTLAEIASGEAIDTLLQVHRGELPHVGLGLKQ